MKIFLMLIMIIGTASFAQAVSFTGKKLQAWQCEIDERPSDGNYYEFLIEPSQNGYYRAKITVKYGGDTSQEDLKVIVYDKLQCDWSNGNSNLVWCDALDANSEFYRIATTQIEESFIDSYSGNMKKKQTAKFLLDSPEIIKKKLFNAGNGKSGMLLFDLLSLKNCGFK